MLSSSSILISLSSLLIAGSGAAAQAPAGPWDAFNFAPKTRTVYAASIRHAEPSVSGSGNLLEPNGSSTVLSEKGAWVTLDFGKEVGGLISMNFDSINSSSSSISLAFTESPMFINPLLSDDSSFPIATMNYDGVLPVPVPPATALEEGFWTQPAFSLRGGFRFLTIALTSKDGGAVAISNVSCEIEFMPHVEDMTAYSGYFYAKDNEFEDEDFLTKLWYAGAYTVQTNTVPVNTGRQVPFEPQGHWANNATLGVASPIIVDGAKRDRAVWPGDMGIAVPTQFVSTFDLIPTRNALSTMFANINPQTGALPESGPPLSQLGSDTYHCWTMIGSYNYYLYSGDDEWLGTIWANYTKAMAFIEGKVDSSGLMNVTGLRDWARQGGGGHNSEGNAILYRVLITGSELATYANQTTLSTAWARNASSLKTNFNNAFWMPEVGMYRDNTTTTLAPQDANSFAILFNLTMNASQAAQVSEGLEKNWVDLGPVPPELPDTISPFISGFELQAHFVAGNDSRAFDLLHREWGYILYTNLSVQSTLLEGMTANGSLFYRYYQGYNDDAAYTSHAHGWSSGPTSALTIYVAGLSVTSPQGKTWNLEPHIGGPMDTAQAGFSTALGWYEIIWERAGKSGLNLNVTTPEGTNGVFTLPNGVSGTVKVNGRAVKGNGKSFELEGGALQIEVS
ncbi:glycoside hydrolase family 78 protein [Collybiopsis luxurians FD-317 M1]|uniref:Unplaced genomic scaffold GYMLUscaffold_149, whole genome shotgun sequence n=1 Tax=Collybiopsis luxurians FD-317 M1 TaxID=944289 RepID=A0A0D0AK47_9AGAR|nr:glycoside hydrolase family 78 protein [Collybiopsis luxurians FD-317 M1]